jgi:hypothetical protein
MRYLLVSACIGLIVGMAGCGEQYEGLRAEGLYGSEIEFYREDKNTIEESLFKEDQEVISNEAIDKILSSKIILPEKGKMSILRFSDRQRWFYWSEELSQLDEQITSEFKNKIQTSKRLEQVSFIPSMIIPKQMTISQMRAAAARMQSNFLLVYRTSTRTYEKYRFLGQDETKAYSTVEAILMDVRTGTIPYTSIKTEAFTSRKTEKEMEFYETIRTAEQQATKKALNKIADELVEFLNTGQ